MSVSSSDTFTQNLVIRLTNLWKRDDWVGAWVLWEDPNKSESFAGWVNPPNPWRFSVECPVDGVLDTPIALEKMEMKNWKLSHKRALSSV